MQGSPHTRGDGPSPDQAVALMLVFSPHAWGWSGIFFPSPEILGVLPTRVGMVRLPSE